MKKLLSITLLLIVLLITPLSIVNADGTEDTGGTLEEMLNNLIGPKKQYSTMLSPVYLKNNLTEEYINPTSGELTLTQTDYVLQGRNGLDLEIKRIYKSGISNVGEMKVKYVNGAWVDYVDNSAETTSFYEERYNLGIGTRFSFAGIEIRENENGSSHKFLHTEGGYVYRLKEETQENGEKIYMLEGQTIQDAIVKINTEFSNGQNDGTSKYVLIRKDGKKTYFSEDGRILGIVDRYGNTITFEYETLKYSIDGKEINKKLISKITDTVGREVTFEYKEDPDFTVEPIEEQQYTKEDSYKASQNPNTTDSGDLKDKFQVIINLPGNKKIIYDKSAVLVSETKHVLRTRLQRVFDVDGKPKYHFWYEQPNLGFTFTNGTNYSAYVRYENLAQIDYCKTNKIKRYTYNSYKKGLNRGSMEYSKVFSKEELAKQDFDNTNTKFIHKFIYDTINKIDYSYNNEPDGFGTEGYKGYDENYLENIYRYSTNVKDKKGNITRYTYDGLHQLLKTEKEGTDHREIITTEHDEMKLTKKRERIIYDVKNVEESGKFIKKIENFRYDKYGNLTNYTGADAERDEEGYPINTEHMIMYSYDYDKYHVPILKTWKKDKDTTCQEIYTVDDKGNVVKEEKINTDDKNKWIITDYKYDTYGNLIEREVHGAENNYKTYYKYGTDEDGTNHKGAYLTKDYKYVDGQEIAKKYAYDFNTGAITSEIDEDGNRTDYTYDILSRVIRVDRSDKTYKEYVYKNNPYKNKEIEYTDPENSKFLYEYDIQGNLVKASVYDKEKWNVLQTIEYDSHGNKTKELDSNGHSIVLKYDSQDRLTKKSYLENDTVNKASMKLEYTTGYDSDTAILVSLTDEEGYVKNFYYDINNWLIKKEISPDDKTTYTTTYKYDYIGNTIEKIDGKNNTTKYQYDNLGRLVKKIDPMGNEIEYTYNSINKVLKKKDIGGKITEYVYDDIGRIKRKKIYEEGSQEYIYTDYTYDKRNNPLEITQSSMVNGINRVDSNIEYKYNNMNRMIDEYVKIDENRTSHTAYKYNNKGKKIQHIEYMNKEENSYKKYSYDYDFAGRLIKEEGIQLETDVQGKENEYGYYLKEYTYDYAGNLSKSRILNGENVETSTYTYDYKNRLIEKTEPFTQEENRITKYKYDRKDNLLSETVIQNEQEITTSFKYDGLDRVIWEMDPLLNITRYKYDANDNIIKKVNPNEIGMSIEEASGIEFEYDSLNRNIKTILFDGEEREVIEYKEYDSRSNPIKIVDGEGYNPDEPEKSIGETYKYNILDKVIEHISAQTVLNNKLNGTNNFTTKYTYNSLGNITSTEDSYGDKTVYSYYLNGRLKEKIYPDNKSEKYDYDLTGKAIEIKTDRAGNTTKTYNTVFGEPYKIECPDNSHKSFEYSNKGQLVESIDSLGYSIFYKYDLIGNQIETKQFSKEDDIFNYYKLIKKSYDKVGLLLNKETFELKEPKTLNVEPTLISAEDKIEYIYDEAGKLILKLEPNNRETIFEYDQNGNIISKNQRIDDQPYNYDITEYEYNIKNQVIGKTKLIRSSNIDIAYLLNAEFDNVYRNRIKVTTKYEYFLNGQLKSKTDPNGNKTSFEYDYDKNLIKKTSPLGEETNYTYDLKGNLIEEKNPKGISTYYDYDNLNRLIRKKQPSIDEELAVTRYVYDLVGNLIKEISPKYYEEEKDTKELVNTMKGIEYTYDNMNRKVKVISPEGEVLQYIKYDLKGQVIKQVDGLRYTGSLETSKGINYKYDGIGRVVEKTDALENSIYYKYDILGNLVAQTNPKGLTTRYEYNPEGTLKEVIYPDEGKVSFTYDYLGRKTSQTDQRGNTTEYKYNSFGKLSQIKDPYGNTIEYIYDLNGNKVSQTDKKGNKTIYKYDENNRLLERKIPLYKNESQNIIYLVEKIIYDEVGNILQKIGYGSDNPKEKRQTNYTYYQNNKVKTITDNNGGYTKQYYDKNGNVIKVENLIDGNEYQITKYQYDSLNRLTKEIYLVDEESIYNTENTENLEKIKDPEYPNKLQIITEYKYDILGNKIEIINPKNTTRYSYDELNRVTKINNIYNSQEVYKEYVYDQVGNKIKETNEKGQETSYVYDEMNRAVEIIDSKGNSIKMAYDKAGNKTAMTNAKGNKISYTYDKLNRQVLTIDPYEKVIDKKIYDENGNIIKQIDANGYLSADIDENRYGIEYIYDIANRLVKVIEPEGKDKEGNTTIYKYNSFGEKIEVTDGLGNTTKYKHDNGGRLTQVTEPDGTTTKYAYDKLGNKQYMINGRGKITKYIYNDLGWLTETINPEGKSIEYKYDLVGNTVYITDRNENHIIQKYDNRNLLISKEVIKTGDEITYKYDELGNTIEMIDESGITTYIYDEINLLKEVKKDGETQISYTHDEIGNIETITDEKGFIRTYTYDKSSRIKTVNYLGKTTAYTYDENGNVDSIEYPNGAIESYSYDKNNRLVKLINKGTENNIISGYSYTYDLAGRQISKTDSYGTTEYEYDSMGRITKVQAPGKTSIYAYDKEGNRTSLNQTYISQQTSDYIDQLTGEGVKYKIKKSQYVYSDGNMLMKLVENMYDEENELVLRKTTKYLYDNNGNELKQQISYIRPHTMDKKQITKGSAYGDTIVDTTNTLIQKENKTYNGFNQLKTVEKIQQGVRTLVEYTYNGDGLRTQKKVRSSEEGYEEKITNFIYDRQHVILETDSQNNVKTRYIRGLAYISSLDNENNSNYYFYNGHGDVVQTINEAGEVQNQYAYDIFGNPTLTVEVYSNNIRYAGEYLDKETGLYYLRARYYNPYIGRFISEDSYWGEDSNTLSLNLYTYAHNDPIRFIDPSGHRIEDVLEATESEGMSDSYRQVLIDGFIKKIDSLKKIWWEEEDNKIGSQRSNGRDDWTSVQKSAHRKANELRESLAILEVGNETVKKLVEQKGDDAGTWEKYNYERNSKNGKYSSDSGIEEAIDKFNIQMAEKTGKNVIGVIDARTILKEIITEKDKELYEYINRDEEYGIEYEPPRMSAFEDDIIMKVAGNIVIGMYEGGKDTVVGLYQVVRHPIKTAKGFWQFMTLDQYESFFLGQKLRAQIDEYVDSKIINGDSQTRARIVGKVTAEVILGILADKGVAKGIKALKSTDKLVDLTRIFNKLDETGDIAKIVDNVDDMENLGDSYKYLTGDAEDYLTYVLDEDSALYGGVNKKVVKGTRHLGGSSEMELLLDAMPELSGSNREKLLSVVQNKKLSSIVNELYRPGAKVGDGGTATKLMQEFYEGSTKHLNKAKSRLNELNKLANSGDLGLNDLDIVDALRMDLENAIKLFD